MTRKTLYNWSLIYRQTREAIAEGKCKPYPSDIARYLDIPQSTYAEGMFKAFGLRGKDFANLTSAPWPSELQEAEQAGLPPQYHDIMPADLIKLLRKNPMSLSELADHLDRGTSKVEQAIQAMITDGVGIVIEEGKATLPDYKPASPLPTIQNLSTTEITWGCISDIHIGSYFAQLSALLKFIEIAYKKHKVRAMLVSGDIVAGEKVYRGQQNELYAMGADDQKDAVINTLPKYKGLQYYLMGGNHDASFMRWAGLNIVKMICDAREDFVYAGFDQAEIPILEKNGRPIASTVLWHPSGGVPYAVSYRGQKIAAEITRKGMLEMVMKEEPAPIVRWVQWGHLHVSDFFPHGPMWVFGPGCFEGTNGYLKAKGLTPMIQGVVYSAKVTDNGLIQSSCFYPYQFIEQENDYMCGHIPSLKRRAERIEPVFRAE